MRRLTLVAMAVFLATSLAGAISVFNASEAREGTSAPPPAGAEASADASDPYFQVVDNAEKGRFRAPGWDQHPADSETYGEDYVTAESSAGAASFRVKIPHDDYYSVYARWPGGVDNASVVRFSISTASGMESDEVDQGLDGGFWVRIGAYEMERGERVLQISGTTGQEGRVVADAVMVIRDVLVGRDGRTASYANPDELAPETSVGDAGGADGGGEPTFSTRSHNNPTGRDVVRLAKRHLGTPYGHTRCRNNVREDCSCHTRLVYRHFGWKLPDSPVRQWRMKAGKKIHRKANLRRGNLVFHDLNRDGALDDHYKDHVSIWAGNGNIIHASSYFGKVVISEEKYLNGFWGGKKLRLK
jgi:cell wall-associated NlpC family hydrolase